MNSSTPFDIPSISTLVAFEATVRLGGVSRAAGALNTSKSAVSRQIRKLEAALGVTLLERRNRRVVPTESGEDYYVVVKSSLESLHAAGHGLHRSRDAITIGCTREVSELLLSSVFSTLQRSLPAGHGLRVLNWDSDALPLVVPNEVDIVFEYSMVRNDAHSVRVLHQEVVPVASPALRRRFERVLSRHPRHWSGVPRLEADTRNHPWPTWRSWFDAHDCRSPEAPVEAYESYVPLLDAAVNGNGMALGWNGFMGSHFSGGRLVPLKDEWLTSGVGLYAVLTPHGLGTPGAGDCLKELASLARAEIPSRQQRRLR